VLVPDPTLQLILDLVGIFVFALSGAIVAIRAGLDALGVLVLASVAGLGGGVLRDVLIGHLPPAALRDWRYLVVSLGAGILTFVTYRRVRDFRQPVRLSVTGAIQLFDAAGLGVFAVTGTVKALAAGLGPLPAALLGVLTAAGGGALRDVLAGQVPIVLQRELYALPALSGAVIVVVAQRYGFYDPALAIGAAAFVFVFRVVALRYDWHAPRVGTA
jgi:uncharacterized membrane protein YeiH